MKSFFNKQLITLQKISSFTLRLSRLWKIALTCILVITLLGTALSVIGYYLQKPLIATYEKGNSIVIKDRKGIEICILPNEKGYWARYVDITPPRFKELLLLKEDKYFYYHPGFNPVSLLKYALSEIGLGNRAASSTITQQLAKILLGNELDRSLKNKIVELFYAVLLELFHTKEELLRMYVNSIHFGNQAQGIGEASRTYFNLSPDLLSDGQILQLLVTINNPSNNNPAKLRNKEKSLNLSKQLKLNLDESAFLDSISVKENLKGYSRYKPSYFEISSLLTENSNNQTITLDLNLNEKIREIVRKNLQELRWKKANNAAVVVIKLPENEIISLIGSPDPQVESHGYQINMISQPRPIGSTIKPFIYLKSFEKGLRPYTLVDDREYKYITALGLPLYPKNFDWKYRGEVDLYYALSNSLNVPAVKVLEYVGLSEFYDFLEVNLGFKPIKPWESYQLGIALGGLDMNLLDLCKYYTIFPNGGVLRELKIHKDLNLSSKPPVRYQEKRIIEPVFIELINKILQDRLTGMEQFGMKSILNLPQNNYALKTGTSRDYRDSWVVGYTPDYLVGVWVGNSDNSPMEEVSGQFGAGIIWAEVMGMLLNSEYNLKQQFSYNHIKEYSIDNKLTYGLPRDDFNKHQNILKELDHSLILKPHHDDLFQWDKNLRIIFRAKEEVSWYVNEKFLAQSIEVTYKPEQPGSYTIKAMAKTGAVHTIFIQIKE